MINNKIDAQVATEVAAHEGLVRQAYKDTKGIWTWSIGLTNASGHNVDRYIGKPQTLEHCLDIYVWALERYAKEVREAFTKPLTQAQFAAALSFHYNTGAIKRASWVKKFNAGDIAGAKRAIMEWKKPAEIIPRRQKERDLFFDRKWSNDGTILEYTSVNAKDQPINPKRTEFRSAMERVFKPKGAEIPVVDLPAPSKPNNSKNVTIASLIVGAIIAIGTWLKSIGIIP